MKEASLRFISILTLMILLVGCSGMPAATPTMTEAGQVTTLAASSTPLPSSTPDPCSPEQIDAEVQKVHRHMREFDDASILASNLPREQLSGSIADLQRIRREADDEQTPACLNDLKTYQIDHMNSVINTLLAFIAGADPDALEKSISVARDQHDQYTLELARLLGLTVVPATVPVINTPAETESP